MPVGLQFFMFKVGFFFFALFLFLVASVWYVESELETVTNSVVFKGGPQFWKEIESKLSRTANTPDLPPEKKAQIIQSLKKIGVKYGPYWDAINTRQD